MHESVRRVKPLRKRCIRCRQAFLIWRRGTRAAARRHCTRRCQAFTRRKRATIRTLPPRDLAYIAGLFDGEGSIILWDRGSGGRPQLRCTVSNTYGPLMDWLKRVARAGSIVRHVHPASTGYKDSLTWQVYGPNAVALLRQMLPHLIVKRDKARAAIKTQAV